MVHERNYSTPSLSSLRRSQGLAASVIWKIGTTHGQWMHVAETKVSENIAGKKFCHSFQGCAIELTCSQLVLILRAEGNYFFWRDRYDVKKSTVKLFHHAGDSYCHHPKLKTASRV